MVNGKDGWTPIGNPKSAIEKEERAMKCTQCQMENIEGALFCEECGAQLESKNEQQETMKESPAERLVLASADGSTLEIPAKEEVVIGREDPISEVFPDIDLTGFGGMEKGVSRKHALIHRSGADYTVEDMGSTNGTYVNRKKILPNTPLAIKSGDEIRFGKLAFSLKAA
jgi:pSer/pThr/pTyr-binding forkhead associated (FHA) protein